MSGFRGITVVDGGPLTREMVAAGIEMLKANRPPLDHVYGCECDLCNPITRWVLLANPALHRP